MCKLFGVNAIVIITSRFHCGSQFSIPCEDNYTCELNCLYLFKAPSINLLFGQCFCLLNYLFGYCVIYLAISVFTVGLRKEERVSFWKQKQMRLKILWMYFFILLSMSFPKRGKKEKGKTSSQATTHGNCLIYSLSLFFFLIIIIFYFFFAASRLVHGMPLSTVNAVQSSSNHWPFQYCHLILKKQIPSHPQRKQCSQTKLFSAWGIIVK